MGKAVYHSKIGDLFIYDDGGFITRIDFTDEDGGNIDETALTKAAVRELDEYFRGMRQTFDLPLAPEGTPFMKRVWQCLQQIPYGSTCSYKEIARMAGNDHACRAVGMANNRNPIPIIIPCHRVIGSKGDLVGYGGGLEIKKALLDLEKRP